MLDKSQLHELFEKLGVPSAGRTLVQKARKEAPVRQVQSRGGNVVTVMSSRKMHREIRTESRHLEFAAAVHLEFDDNVLEFYPQPSELHFTVVDDDGEIHDIRHTPDFLAICNERLVLIECKSEAKLQRLATRYPWRYKQDLDGNWHAPLIEAHFANLGISYQLWTERTLNPLRTENLLHIADYLLPGAEPCPQSTIGVIAKVLQEHGYVYVDELLAEPYRLSADHINKAIADKQVTTSLDTETLSKPGKCRLFRDETLMQFVLSDPGNKLPAQERFDYHLQAGDSFLYEGQTLTISLLGEKQLICSASEGSTRTLSLTWIFDAIESKQIEWQSKNTPAAAENFSKYTQEQLKQALAREKQLALESPKVSDRTIRRWKKRQCAAAANGGNASLALIPDIKARGNRQRRLTEEQLEIIELIIRKHWAATEAKNYKACFRFLQDMCAQRGVKCPSYPTLIAAIDAKQTNQTIRIRFGKRMAHQQSTFVDVLHADTPQHGSRPLQYVHIDHTQLDIELLSSRTGLPLGRPWLTLAIDAYSRRVLSLYVTYEPPSYTSVMMCMRSMVQRYKRLPEFIIVDNGRDLTSTAFGSFLHAMGTNLRMRPAGQPRHGAVLERLFGRMHTEYIHNLAGNTKLTKNVRMVSGKHLPKHFAEWTLESLYYGLQHWAFEYYDQEIHSTLDMSPRQAFERGIAQTGQRNHRMILCNTDFLIATCPPVDRRGERRVDGQRGVKVNDLLYWNEAFSSPHVAGKTFPVRYDPWDASSVYVMVNNVWLRAQCRALLSLGHLTETEREALSAEYRNRSGKKVNEAISSQKLREFLQTFTPEGALALALDRQDENKKLYSKLELANVSPVLLPRKPGLGTHVEESSQASAPNPELEPMPAVNKLHVAPETDTFDTLFDTF